MIGMNPSPHWTRNRLFTVPVEGAAEELSIKHTLLSIMNKLKKTLLIYVCFAVAISLTSCDSTLALTKQKNATIKVMGTRFREPAAYRADLLWVGDKINEAGIRTLATYDYLRIGTSKIPTVETVLILDQEKSKEMGLSLSDLSSYGIAQAGLTADGKTINKGFIEIAEIRAKRELLEELNAPRNRMLREHMFRNMNDPRIVTAVAKVGTSNIKDFPNYTEAQNSGGTVTISGTLQATGTPGKFQINGGWRNKISSTFSTGTVVGYKVCVPAWRMEGGVPIVADYVEDVQGIFRQFEAKAIAGSETDRSKISQAQ